MSLLISAGAHDRNDSRVFCSLRFFISILALWSSHSKFDALFLAVDTSTWVLWSSSFSAAISPCSDAIVTFFIEWKLENFYSAFVVSSGNELRNIVEDPVSIGLLWIDGNSVRYSSIIKPEKCFPLRVFKLREVEGVAINLFELNPRLNSSRRHDVSVKHLSVVSYIGDMVTEIIERAEMSEYFRLISFFNVSFFVVSLYSERCECWIYFHYMNYCKKSNVF